jgi:single-stranded DNA-binding protein
MSREQEFTFQGTAVLRRIDRFTSKTGETYLTLIFDTDGNYPQVVPIKVFGKLAEEASDWVPGSLLTVHGRLGVRDWNGKVFGDSVATRVDVRVKGAQGEQGEIPGTGGGPAGTSGFHGQSPNPDDDDVPF